MNKKESSDMSPELRALFDGIPTTDEVLAALEEEKLDLEHDPVFVAGYLKGKFVNDILLAMKESHVTQSDLAQRLNESRQYVSRVLNEQGNFTIATMAKFACALNCRISIDIFTHPNRVAYKPADSDKHPGSHVAENPPE